MLPTHVLPPLILEARLVESKRAGWVDWIAALWHPAGHHVTLTPTEITAAGLIKMLLNVFDFKRELLLGYGRFGSVQI